MRATPGVPVTAYRPLHRVADYRAAQRIAPKPAPTTSTTRLPAPTTTVPAPPPTTAAHVEVASAPVTAPPVTTPSGYGCGPALSYLATHSAPGFRFECPGYADGHQAMTCINVAGLCPGESLIAISDPCPAAYMNEAHNSWIEAGLAQGAIDPYGYCH